MGIEVFIATALAGLVVDRVRVLLRDRRNGKLPTMQNISDLKSSVDALSVQMNTYCQINDGNITTLRERVTKLED